MLVCRSPARSPVPRENRSGHESESIAEFSPFTYFRINEKVEWRKGQVQNRNTCDIYNFNLFVLRTIVTLYGYKGIWNDSIFLETVVNVYAAFVQSNYDEFITNTLEVDC